MQGIPEAVESSGKTKARVTATIDGKTKNFEAIVRIDTPQESEYYRSGGILPYVLRQLAAR
jgi:aconitate hydratase